MDINIVPMKESDWPEAAEIFREGIETCLATFETHTPDYDTWDRDHCKLCRLVARAGAEIAGWAALSPVNRRAAYSGAAEVSIYIKEAYKRKGVGMALMNALIPLSERSGFWTLQGLITAENAPSLALFAKCGFREVGFREKIGRTPDGIWHDVVLMERRSKTVGLN